MSAPKALIFRRPCNLATFATLMAASLALSGCSTVVKREKANSPVSTSKPLSPEAAAILGANRGSATPTAPLESPGSSLNAPMNAPMGNPSSTVQALQARIDALEAKLAAMSERVDTTQTTVSAFAANQKAKPAPLAQHPADRGGVKVTPVAAAHDPAAGFANDDAVHSFRRGLVKFKAERYSDSVLEFSSFVEKYPDHPLAGAAQFYVGESYFRQKEYKLAIHEFQRVLTSYDRSSHVARTLKQLAEAEDAIKKTEDAARHRQLLMSLFPHSPFAVAETAVESKPALDHVPTAPAAPKAPAAAPKAAAHEEPTGVAPAMNLDPIPLETHPATDGAEKDPEHPTQ